MSNTKLLNVDQAEADIIEFETMKTVVMGTTHDIDADMEMRYMEDTATVMTWESACALVDKNQHFHISMDGYDGFVVGIIQVSQNKLAYLVI